MEEGPKRRNRQHPKRSTFSENRWERLYKTITHALLAISNVRTEVCACARTRVIFIGYHRVAIPWLPNVTYGTGRLISIPRGEITIVPFLFGSRSPETVGWVVVGRMVITYCQAVALVRPRLMGHRVYSPGVYTLAINAAYLTELERM